MKHMLCSTMKNYKKEYLPKDIFSGIIMAAVSIPISMAMHRLPDCLQYMDYTVRYSRFCSLHCSQHRGNSFSESMRHRRQLSEQHWYHLGLKAEVKRQCSMCL